MSEKPIETIMERRRLWGLDDKAEAEVHDEEPTERNGLSAEQLRKRYEIFIWEAADHLAALGEVIRALGDGKHPSLPYVVEAIALRLEHANGWIESAIANLDYELGDTG